MEPSPPFPFPVPDDYRRLREGLAAAHYSDGAIAALLGEGLSGLGAKKRAAQLRRVSGGSPLETLVRVFVLGAPVDAAALEAALPTLPLAWLAERGLLTIDGDQVRATVQLRCYQGLIVAFDFSFHGQVLPPDYVMGISPSTLTLAGLTIRRPIRSALDLGTGSGFHAFLAAQHSERVVATDKNPRAVEVARFNAALNGLAHIECREGDLFEPVEDEMFDLIVSNPPFIISPENVYYFLHSGLTGDEVCRRIAHEAGRYLAPGGHCQFLANWTEVKGEDWRDRIAGWCEGTGCDALVLRRGRQLPDVYAAEWIQAEEGENEFEHALGVWAEYYERLGVEAIGSGLITLRRSESTPHQPWYWADDAPETMTFPAGADIERMFVAQDFLRVHPGEALLSARLRLSDDVHLEQEARPGPDGWGDIVTRLRRGAGLHWSGGIDPYGARMLGECDGTRSVRELLDEMAAAADVDWTEEAPTWLAVLSRLTERGFLVPVGDEGRLSPRSPS